MQPRIVAALITLGLIAGAAVGVVANDGPTPGGDLPATEVAAAIHRDAATTRAIEWNADATLTSIIGTEGRFPRGLVDPPLAWDASSDPNPGNGLAVVWTYLFRAPDVRDPFYVSIDGDGAIRYANTFFSYQSFGQDGLTLPPTVIGSARAVEVALGDTQFAEFAAKHPAHGTVLILGGWDEAVWQIVKVSDMDFGVGALVSASDGKLLETHAWPQPIEPCATPVYSSDPDSASSTTTAYPCPPPPCESSPEGDSVCPPPCDPCCNCYEPPAPPDYATRSSGSLSFGQTYEDWFPVESVDHKPVITVDVTMSGLLREEVDIALLGGDGSVIDKVRTRDGAVLVAPPENIYYPGEYMVRITPASNVPGQADYDVSIAVEYGPYTPRDGWVEYIDSFSGNFQPLGGKTRTHSVMVGPDVSQLIVSLQADRNLGNSEIIVEVFDEHGTSVAIVDTSREVAFPMDAPGAYTFEVRDSGLVASQAWYYLTVKGFAPFNKAPVPEATPVHAETSVHNH